MKLCAILKWVPLLAVMVLPACFAPKIIKQEQLLFKDVIVGNAQVTHNILEVGEDKLFYATAGDPQNPALIIMHGTPGNWQQYARYLLDEDLLEHFYIAVIDRPGWGQSTLGNGKRVATFSEHALILSTLANKFKDISHGQPVILMGHSLGASIAPRVAMDYPQAIDGLLLFAGTLSPELSEPRWFNYVAKWPGVNFIIGDMMRKSNQEILALKAEMRAMEPQWQQLQAKTIVVQGMKDNLVYPANIEFAENSLNPAITETLRLEEDGHLFPMTRRDDVVLWSGCMLEKINGGLSSCDTYAGNKLNIPRVLIEDGDR